MKLNDQRLKYVHGCGLWAVTSILLNFVLAFKRALEDNAKQAEFERKKAEKDAEKERMRNLPVKRDEENAIFPPTFKSRVGWAKKITLTRALPSNIFGTKAWCDLASKILRNQSSWRKYWKLCCLMTSGCLLISYYTFQSIRTSI